MSRISKILAIMAMSVGALSVMAADREQYHINELTLGDPAVLLTARGTDLNQVSSNKFTFLSGATLENTDTNTLVITEATNRVVGKLEVSGDVSLEGDLVVTSNATVNGTVDTDSITVDAAAGIDTKTAGTLTVGAATATKVEIADAGITTEVQGKLDVAEGQVWAFALKTGNNTNVATDTVLSFTTSALTTNTLLEASTVLGQIFVIALFSDGGDLIVKTDGTDKFDGAGNDILTFADAGDSCWVQATAADAYTILVNVGGTLSN